MPDTSLDAIQTLQQLGLIPPSGQPQPLPVGDLAAGTAFLPGSLPNVDYPVPPLPGMPSPSATSVGAPSIKTIQPSPIDLPTTEPIQRSLNPKPSDDLTGSILLKPAQASISQTSPTNKSNKSVEPKFGDLGQAINSENTAIDNSGNLAKTAGVNLYEAKKSRDDKIAAANFDYVNNLQKAEEKLQLDRETARKGAQLDVANEMRDLDKKAKEQPDPHHWFESRSTFSKVMWLLSLAFGTKASQTPGIKSAAFDMIQNSMADDVAQQRARLAKETDNIKLKGQLTKDANDRKLTDINTDFTHQVGRINALLAANTVKANSTSDPDLKAQLSEIDKDLNERKVNLAVKRVDAATQERLKIVDENHADYRQNLGFKHTQAMQNANQSFEANQHELNRQLQRDLAQEKIDAKLASDLAKAKKGEGMFEFAGGKDQAGVRVESKDDTGKPVTYNLAVPKELAKDASQLVQNGQAKIVALTSLRDAFANDKTPYGTFYNDNEARQALKALADPAIRQMGGRFNKDTVKETQELMIGEDPTSLISRIKGGTKEDIVALLNKEIQEAPGAVRQHLNAIPGINIANDPGASIVFTTPDTRGPKEHELTGDEKIEASTGKAAPPVTLKSNKDVEKYGDEARASMPGDLRAQVENTKAKFEEGHNKKDVQTIHDQAGATIDAWLKDHPAGKEQAYNAVKILEYDTNKAKETANKIPAIIANMEQPTYGSGNVTKTDVQDELSKKKITAISSKEIQDMVDEINKARSKFTLKSGE